MSEKPKSFPRVRTKGGLVPGPMCSSWRINGSCSETSWTMLGQNPTTVGEVITMSDYVTPNFRKLQAEGKVAFNPMSFFRQRMTYTDPGNGQENERQTPDGCSATGAKQRGRSDGPFVVIYHNPNGAWVYPSLPSFSHIITDDEIRGMSEEVVTKVLADRGKGSDNLWESIFEYKQTLAMFSDGLNRLWGWFGKNQSPLSKMTPQQAWLQYRYGILPFVRDVKMILKGLEKPVGKRRQTSRANLKTDRFKESGVDSGTWQPAYKVFSKIQIVEHLEVRAMSLDEYIADVQSNIGLSTKGLLTVPWELIPYSFVVDWFLNVGDYINALAPAPGYTQLGSALSVKWAQVALVTVTGLSVTDPNYLNKRMPSGAFELVTETKTRGALGLPTLRFKFDFKLDEAVRLADSIALLLQKFGASLGR
jgi:hypothetical protein